MFFSVNIYTPRVTFDQVANAYCRICGQDHSWLVHTLRWLHFCSKYGSVRNMLLLSQNKFRYLKGKDVSDGVKVLTDWRMALSLHATSCERHFFFRWGCFFLELDAMTSAFTVSLSLVAGKFQFEIRSALRFQNHLSGSWKKSWREMPVPRLAPHMSWHCGLDSWAKARGETGLLIARLFREPGNRWGFQAGLSGGCCKSSWDTFTSNRKLQEQT